MDSIEVIQRDQYEDGKEFAQLAAKVLYNFYTLPVRNKYIKRIK